MSPALIEKPKKSDSVKSLERTVYVITTNHDNKTKLSFGKDMVRSDDPQMLTFFLHENYGQQIPRKDRPEYAINMVALIAKNGMWYTPIVAVAGLNELVKPNNFGGSMGDADEAIGVATRDLDYCTQKGFDLYERDQRKVSSPNLVVLTDHALLERVIAHYQAMDVQLHIYGRTHANHVTPPAELLAG